MRYDHQVLLKVMTFCPLVSKYRMNFIKYHLQRESSMYHIKFDDMNVNFAKANSSVKTTMIAAKLSMKRS